MATPRILVGCDPELFLKNSEDKFISAHDILPGTKAEPHPVSLGAVQVDGVAAEFNITPAASAGQFITNIHQVMTSLKDFTKGQNLAITPFANFEPSYFNSLPDTVKELGCNPDFNAWTGQVNPPPDASGTMRTASGHLHVGWLEGKGTNPFNKFHFEDCRIMVKQLDYYIGIYSLMWDPDNTRRQLYGKAGAMRPKSYGVEYRVLSNQWLKSQRVMEWLFGAVQKAAGALFSGKKSMEELFGDYAQKVIDNNEVGWSFTKEGQLVHAATGLTMPDLRDFQDPKLRKPRFVSGEGRSVKEMELLRVLGYTIKDVTVKAT